PKGAVAGMVSLGNRIVLVVATPGPLWEWNGSEWRPLPASDGPSSRTWPAVTTGNGQLILFGGRCPPRYCGDTWRWIDGGWARFALGTDGPADRTTSA